MGAGLHGVSAGFGGSVKLYDLTLGAAAAGFDTGATLPGGYDVLELWALLRTDEAVATSVVDINFNGDTGANYERYFIRASNSVTTASGNVADTRVQLAVGGASLGASAFTLMRMSIPFYAQTTAHKVGEFSTGIPDTAVGTTLRSDQHFWRWRSTAAINRVAFDPSGAVNFIAGSRLLIYGR